MRHIRKITSNILKRFLSISLALIMILGAMPLESFVSFALDEEISKVTEIDIIKNFNGTKLDEIIIKVIGEHVDKATAHIDLGANKSKLLSADNNSTDTFRQYVLTAQEIEQLGGIGKEVIITDKANGTKRYSLGDDHMPTILNITPASGLIKTNENITITGDRLNKIGENNITGYFKPSGTILPIKNPEDIDDGKIVKNVGTQVGKYAVVFEQNETLGISGNNKVEVKVKREHHYLDLFTVYGELNVSDDINMFPNQGSPGTYVTIAGENLTSNMSVFFLKNETDQYNVKNMGEFVDYRQDADEKTDHYIVKVPNLEQGAYRVVLTNKVDKGQDPKKVVNSSKTFKNNVFIIISDLNKPTIEEIRPSKGPATGIDATIRGRFLGSISPNIFKINAGVVPEMYPEGDDDGVPVNSDSLVITYGDGTDIIGKYTAIDTVKGGVDVVKLERRVKGYIGNPLGFRKGSELSPGGFDSIQVTVPNVTDEKEDPVKDVTLEIETIISYEIEVTKEDGTIVKEIRKITLTETVIKPKGFTFEQLGYEPKITSVTPGKIPVYKITDNNYRTLLEDFKIGIYGENFSIYRYVEKDANGKDIVKHKYPLVNIGNQIVLDKNKNDNIEIKVFDKNGNEIDGTEGNELGVKILISIPKDLPSNGLGDGFIGTNTEIWVTNPLRNSNPTEMGTTSNAEFIQFVDVDSDKIPTITEITPNTVTTDGEKGVVITGQNFDRNVKVYIDGEEIKGIKRNDIGTEIVFDAPSRREGYYQIIVQNEEGGADTYYPFTYVKTYTNPKIIDFNPKKGTSKTLVTLKGENFVPPNPLVKDLQGIGIWKLIGTRVLLGGKDINDYNMDSDKKSPELQSYTAPSGKPLISNNKGDLMLSDYYHSIILEEGGIEKTYYKVQFDTKTGEIKLTDGDKEVYIISIKGSGFSASRDGKEYTLNVNNTDLTIDLNGVTKTLHFKTPYAVKDGLITGNKVKVINNNELIFEVPSMPREGYYDVTVVNPDTKKDSKTGNNGFYYSFQPDFNPEIKEIKPNEGSTDGQYYINISGDKFVDNGGNKKTSVIIGTVVVDPKDIEVSPDGKNLKVKVPKYPGDLAKETDMDRKTVAVVVVNPDGGSASKEDGFTYIIPISHPVIDKLILNKGTAAGGDSVIIEGSGFRFFEPFKDLNNNAQWDDGEPYNDLNENTKWDDLRHWLSPELKIEYEKLAKDYNKNILPILPKVYFGGEEVAIKDFTASTIEVETPKGSKGPVEVYLVNNDHGTSNKIVFTYEASNPKINTISPSIGRKQGNDKVEIMGENFYESKVKVVEAVYKTKEQSLQIVQFGDPKDTNISNRDVPIDAPQNSGKIRDRLSTVKVGNLTVNYDATQDNRKLSFTLEEGTGDNKITYQLKDINYDDTEIFFPVSLLKDKDGNSYKGYEYVRVRLEKILDANVTNRLRVDRGFSPDATLKNSGHIVLKTPSYYTVGKVGVIVTNPDGGEATGQFEYKNPDSKPTITNILRDGQEGILDSGRKIVKVNIKGGNIISVIGTDFRKPVKIKIGDLPEITQGIGYDPSNEPISRKMTFKMPSVDEKYVNSIHRLVIENEDGGVAGSDEANPPIYIQFIKGETEGLSITNVTPKFGPSTGGTVVTIEGKDFRKEMDGHPNEKLKIYFEDEKNQVKIKDEDIIDIQINRIQLKTPPHVPGSVTVKVENPDGSIAELPNAFTYLSNPKITAVVDPADPTERSPISTISILGGQEIKLKGAGFIEGAKVYFSPKVRPANESELGDANLIYIEGNPYILEEGTEGTDYKWINNETVTIKTPQGKTDSFGVIIVNTDKGASPIFTNLIYGLPELAAPSGVVAELVYDRFIRVHWNGVTGATEYEIFVVIDDRTTELIGSTELTSFAYSDLEPRTRYRFIVKAVGDFGSSKPSMESNSVKTGSVVGPPDEDGTLVENTTMTKTGNTANVVIGTRDRDRGTMVVDLTTGALAGSTDLVISLPASVVANNSSRNIQVIGKDFTLLLQPSAFNVANVRDNKNKADAGVRFVIAADSGNTQVQSGNQLSTVYNLGASAYVGKTNLPIDYLASNIDFTLNYDKPKADLRKLLILDFSYFNPIKNIWEPVENSPQVLGSSIHGSINRLGRYTVIGSRR